MIMASQMLRSILGRARSVVVFTGAGISAESGVPTFRGEDGLWKKFRPEELANVDAFMRNPALVWEWYQARKRTIRDVKPNPGHFAIADMEKRHPSFAVVTQNIDNLHRRAGSKNVYELHGNIMRDYCMSCGRKFHDEELPDSPGVPRCPCGGLVRPDVVWFGEILPEGEWKESVRRTERSEVFFSVGTSAVVYPAASLPVVAKRAGAYVVEVNIEKTELSEVADEVLIGRSGEILPALLSQCYEES